MFSSSYPRLASFLRRAFCLCLVAGMLPATVLAASAAEGESGRIHVGAAPAGLSVADWEQIRALLPPAALPSQQAFLKASNTGGGDQFGLSVAISGDTVVVGAMGEDGNAGAAYVFTRSGAVWSQQAYLKASNAEAGDMFGVSVAISGNTVVVGAHAERSNATGVNGDQFDNSLDRPGAAYVFTRSGGVWSQQAYLKASNTGAWDQFGYSVAISGDTVVVGALEEDGKSGAAYVFTRSGAVWSQQAYLKASNTEASDYFGVSVAISGDTVIVGAHQEDSSATGVNGNQGDNSAGSAGAAYVFTRSGGVWSQQAYLKASNTGAADLFGRSVAISGDTVIVGANQEGSSATGVNGDESDDSVDSAGAAYVFTRSGAVWSQQAYLKASNTDWYDYFGYSVAISGDTVVVGAYQEDSDATGVNGASNEDAINSGAAYLFTRSGVTWSQQAYLKASNTGMQDWFGSSVAISGDTVIVGAMREDSSATGVNGDQADNSGTDSGAAYVFFSTTDGDDELPDTGFAPGVASVLPAQPQAYANYGRLWLEIPSLGVEATIVGVPEGWDVTWLGSNAGWLTGTAFPTLPGNTAITAHVYDANGLPGPFVALHRLYWGDRVVIHAWGQRYIYEVRANYRVLPGSMRPLRHEEYDWVTLLTCEGYNARLGGYSYRRVVRAVLIDVAPELQTGLWR